MVQGPNDLIPPTPAAPTTNTANADTFRRKQVQDIQPVQPAPLQQDADTVQLSSNAVQAAAYAKAGGVQPPAAQRAIAQQVFEQQAQGQQPLVQQRIAQEPVANPIQVRPAAPVVPAAAPASVATENTPPVQSLAAASAATPSKTVLRNEPEVRPDQVQAALKNLPTLTGNSGGMNAQLAEKLLTEF